MKTYSVMACIAGQLIERGIDAFSPEMAEDEFMSGLSYEEAHYLQWVQVEG